MPYDEQFYEAYDEYLKEPRVRQSHDFVLSLLEHVPQFDWVIDFGCGRAREFEKYFCPRGYLGIDMCASADKVMDYRKTPLKELAGDFEPSAFVSLFSSEITAPVKENYEFYERIFKELPVQIGVVSGFYYYTKKDRNPVEETGGLVSFQTLEPVESVMSPNFFEWRLVMPVPSKMFGADVVEVWKYFNRSEK